MVTFRIVNVVATAALGQIVDLAKLGRLKWALHDQNIYGGMVAYLKLPTMKGKVSVFFSGKMISVGTRAEQEATDDLEDARDFLVGEGFVEEVSIIPQIRNVVVTADFGESIDLESISFRHNLVYEPEQFPGGIMKLEEPKVTVLLFASGKAVITGLGKSDQIDLVLEKIQAIIA